MIGHRAVLTLQRIIRYNIYHLNGGIIPQYHVIVDTKLRLLSTSNSAVLRL